MHAQTAFLKNIPLPEIDRREMANFCLEDSDRFNLLIKSLRRRRIPYEVIPIGQARHIVLPPTRKSDNEYYRVTLIAHYDRVKGTPGANDNTAAVFQLLDHWEEMTRLGWKHQTQIILTDKEEITGTMQATDQGSWHLARHLKRLGAKNILFFVLDMCGIGNTPVWGRSVKKAGLSMSSNAVSRAHHVMENFLKHYTSGQDFGVNPMFSDDLGLLLGGYPALQLSLLPSREARALFARYKKNQLPETDTLCPAKLRNELRSELPPAWQSNHGPDDKLEHLDTASFLLMKRLLRDLARYRFSMS